MSALADQVAALEREVQRLRAENESLRAMRSRRVRVDVFEFDGERVAAMHSNTFPRRAGDVDAPQVHSLGQVVDTLVGDST